MFQQSYTLPIYTYAGLCTWKISYPLARATKFMFYILICTVFVGPTLPKITEKLWNKCIHSVLHQTTELNLSFTLYGLHDTEISEMQILKRT